MIQHGKIKQKKTLENDGYEALQVGYEEKRANITSKPEKGIFDKANTTPKKFVKEINGDELTAYNQNYSSLEILFALYSKISKFRNYKTLGE